MTFSKIKADAESLKGRTIAPGKLVDSQKGSVVSRTIVERPTGTVTLFAFDKGEGLSEHTAPFDALVQVLGEVRPRL